MTGDRGHQVTTAWEWHGKPVRPGTRLVIQGSRGDYRFVQHVSWLPPRCRKPREWVDVMNAATGVMRAFRTDRITRVVQPRKRVAKSRR